MQVVGELLELGPGRLRVLRRGRGLGGLGALLLRRLGVDAGHREPLQRRAQLADLADGLALLRPAGLETLQLLGHLGALGPQLLQPLVMVAGGRALAIQRRDLHVQQLGAAAQVVDGGGRCALAHGHAGAGGVEHAHRLVRQLAALDVAGRETHRLRHRFVQHPGAVMALELARDAADHADRLLLVRLLDLDDLEAPGECRVPLEILLVLGPGGGSDGAQLAARERGFSRLAASFWPA